jgi:hypothetical protein
MDKFKFKFKFSYTRWTNYSLQYEINVHTLRCLVGVYAIIIDGAFCWTKYCRIMIWYPKGIRDFSLLHSDRAGSGAHPTALSIGPQQSFPKSEATQGINMTIHSHSAEIKNIPPLSHTHSQQPRYNYFYLMFCYFTWQPYVFHVLEIKCCPHDSRPLSYVISSCGFMHGSLYNIHSQDILIYIRHSHVAIITQMATRKQLCGN